MLTDLAGAKAMVLGAMRAAGLAARYAGLHPLVSPVDQGFSGARADLFRGAITYVTADMEGESARQAMRAFVSTVLEGEPVVIDAETHDRQVAWTLELPRAAARAVALALSHAGLGAPPSMRRCGAPPRRHAIRVTTGARGCSLIRRRWLRRSRHWSPRSRGCDRARARRRAPGNERGRRVAGPGGGPMIVDAARASPTVPSTGRHGAGHQPHQRRSHLPRRAEHRAGAAAAWGRGAPSLPAGTSLSAGASASAARPPSSIAATPAPRRASSSAPSPRTPFRRRSPATPRFAGARCAG